MSAVNASNIDFSGTNFSVAHYTGRVSYDANDFSDKNRDFLPPEMIETLRRSTETVVQILFTGLFSKSGNLTVPADPDVLKKAQGRWGAVITAENEKIRARKYNTESRGQYSQTRQMRTASASFRGTCLELLRSFTGACGVHFVRCVRTNLSDQPGAVQADLVKQQIKALGVLDTARGRRRGYSTRIPFQEFIRRYKFLAFDFDEPVDVTKDNCRLLLVRLKMEGWVIGKTKVFLKYYNEEYLSRLYETQVKKIVKVQSMMRAFLAKRSIANKLLNLRKFGSADDMSYKRGQSGKSKKSLTNDEAATIIQKQARGHLVRKQYGTMVRSATESLRLLSHERTQAVTVKLGAKQFRVCIKRLMQRSLTGNLDEDTILFMRKWCRRWQIKSIFQVLLLYRATRHQDLIYFSQQAHLYNQNALSELQDVNETVTLDKIDPKAKSKTFLPSPKPSVHKLPFKLSDLSFFDSSYMCDPARSLRYKKKRDTDETWDAPLQRNISDKYSRVAASHQTKEQECQTGGNDKFAPKGTRSGTNNLPETPFVRENAKGVRAQPKPGELRFGNTRNDSNKAQVYKGNKAPAPKAPQGKERPYNPIREMEDKFRQNSGETEEQPPFNFQAMLRKTNNKRESLRRAEDTGFMSPTNNNIVFCTSNYNNDNNNNNNTNSRPSSRNRFSPAKSLEKNVVELAPGLIIEGEVADL